MEVHGRPSVGLERRALRPPALRPELKGSIGEGPNHSNFSHQSSVKILANLNSGIFAKKIKKNQEISTFSKISA